MTTTPAKKSPLKYHAKPLSIHDMGHLTPHKTDTPSSCTSQSTALFSAHSKFSAATPTGFSAEFNSYRKAPSHELARIPLTPNTMDMTPKAVHQFNAKEMDEFGTSPVSAHLTKRHLSDNNSVLEAHKKSMVDIAARIKRKSVSLTSTQVIQICENSRLEGTENFERNKNLLSRTINTDELNKIRQRIQREQHHRRRASAHTLVQGRSQQVKRVLKIKGKEVLEGERLRDLGNITVLENVLCFLNFEDVWKMSKLSHNFRNQKAYKNIFQQRLNQFFSQGLDQNDQLYFWNNTLNFRQLRFEHPFTFTQHFVKRSLYMEEIKKDLDRTLPEYEKFSTEEGKAALLRVLVATSNTVKDMGYIQGLNSIAGTFLLYLKEEETFWILMYFMEKLKFKDLLNDTFDTINELNYQLLAYLNHYLPEIVKYFREKDFEISYFTTSWFLTLFSHHLSVQNVLKVWNFLFTKGRSFLIQLSLAIFQKYEKNILQMDADEVGPFLKNELNELPINEKELFESALNFKVSKKLSTDFQYYYRNGKPEIYLRVNSLRKVQLKVDSNFRKTSLELAEQKDQHHQGLDLRKNTSTKERINSFFNSFTGEISDSIKSIFSRRPSDDSKPAHTSPSRVNVSNIDEEDAKASHQIAQTQGDALPRSNFLLGMPKITASKGICKTLADEKSFDSDKRTGSFYEERTDIFSPDINKNNESKVERFERRSKKAATSIFSFQKYVTNTNGAGSKTSNGSNEQLSSRTENVDHDTSLVKEVVKEKEKENPVERRSSMFGFKVLSSIFDGKRRIGSISEQTK